MIDWDEYSNSEIETKLKTMAFEYEKLTNEVNEKGYKLNDLNQSYIKGKAMLEKRLNPTKKIK